MTDTPDQPTVFDRFDNPTDAYNALRRENGQLPDVDRSPEWKSPTTIGADGRAVTDWSRIRDEGGVVPADQVDPQWVDVRGDDEMPYVDSGPEILARHEPPNPAKIDAALKAHGASATTRWSARMNATKADRMPEGLEYLPAELDELERDQLNRDFAAGMYDEPATEQAASIARHPSQQPGISR
jgi:hypothetical protein